MARNDDKLLYSSAWDIDQLVEQGTVTRNVAAVGTAGTITETINITPSTSFTFPYVPQVFYSPDASAISNLTRRWHQAGYVNLNAYASRESPFTADDNIFPGMATTNGIAVYWSVLSDFRLRLRIKSWNTSSSTPLTIKYYLYNDRIDH